jgi:1-phosphofructokinase
VIVTVTLNPSFDLTLEVDELIAGGISRAGAERLEAAGKGVNVARALAGHGVATRAVAALDPAAAPRFEELLDAPGVLRVVAVSGVLRTNVTVVEPAGVVTKINGPGPEHSAEGSRAMLAEVTRALDGADWVVLSGSLPPGCPDDTYAVLIGEARRRGCRVALDTEGVPLRLGIAAGPDVVKPNREELQRLTGVPIDTLGDAVGSALAMVELGARAVLCSLGAEGAVLVSRDVCLHGSVPPLEIESHVGAGDALLAGYLAAADESPEHSLRRAVAWGTAACRLPGTQMPGPDDVIIKEVHVASEPNLALLLAAPAPVGRRDAGER